jgi:hypothetical protein
MELQKTVSHVFLQLSLSLGQLETEQYGHPCKNLSGNTIGQHVRHIIEMFQCLETGYQSGEVDYEHTIHHMALIRVGLRELGDIRVDDSYGVAPSTLKYRKQCVQ